MLNTNKCTLKGRLNKYKNINSSSQLNFEGYICVQNVPRYCELLSIKLKTTESDFKSAELLQCSFRRLNRCRSENTLLIIANIKNKQCTAEFIKQKTIIIFASSCQTSIEGFKEFSKLSATSQSAWNKQLNNTVKNYWHGTGERFYFVLYKLRKGLKIDFYKLRKGLKITFYELRKSLKITFYKLRKGQTITFYKLCKGLKQACFIIPGNFIFEISASFLTIPSLSHQK